MVSISSKYRGEITLHFIGVITPVTHLFSAVYRGPITPFVTSSGPLCSPKMDLSQKSRENELNRGTVCNLRQKLKYSSIVGLGLN